MAIEMTNVADVLTRHASERPWAVAIIENDVVVHYRTLERMVWAAAWRLRQAGVAPGDVVGVALPHSALYLAAVYGLARLGAVSTALPPSDPPASHDSFIRRFGVSRIVAETPDIGIAGAPTVMLTAAMLTDMPPSLPADLRFEGGDHPWFIRRTSGTTGDAKGIARTHRASLANCKYLAAYFPGANDRLLAVLDMNTGYGLGVCERTFYGGGAVVVAPLQMDGLQFFDYVDRFAITRLALTANFFSLLLPLLPTDGCRFPGLVDVTSSGMAMPEALRAEVRRRLSPNLSILYGSNESQTLTIADARMQEMYPETVGGLVPGAELEVVDDEDRPLPVGQPGHIRARAPWMPTGYVNASDAANRTFRDGWVYLGDIGVMSPEGMLFIKGRVDDMMNYDGIKIMPTDIEETLLSHPAVAEAVAFPIASNRHQHLPAAAVVLRNQVSGEELLAYCQRQLGQRAPLAISIEAAFPRNATGKIIKAELVGKVGARLGRRPG